ncbi:hypothetical protein GALMADRAFT_148272 [Galerina marginata CBS 339.88]|uniref:Uncharacterized protein n=1 Tax=Galerina marginata (strain CBS 339.88) TaxID=685588 RepID=A0A067S4Z3_GALM3|nr:hypothetical protein GALMADRAFT_148272 [Galerina marginata CBS 339.88]
MAAIEQLMMEPSVFTAVLAIYSEMKSTPESANLRKDRGVDIIKDPNAYSDLNELKMAALQALAHLAIKEARHEVVACSLQKTGVKSYNLLVSNNDQVGDATTAHLNKILNSLKDIRQLSNNGDSNRSKGDDPAITEKADLQCEIYKFSHQKFLHRFRKHLKNFASALELLEKNSHGQNDEIVPKKLRDSIETIKTNTNGLDRELENLIRTDSPSGSSLWKSYLKKANLITRKAIGLLGQDNREVLERWAEAANVTPCWLLTRSLEKMTSTHRYIHHLFRFACSSHVAELMACDFHVQGLSQPQRTEYGPWPQSKEQWRDIAKKLGIKNPHEQLLLKLCKIQQRRLTIHAELVNLIEHCKGLPESELPITLNPYHLIIGVSKLCCFQCKNCIDALNKLAENGVIVIIMGGHDKPYLNWDSPLDDPRMKSILLEGTVAKIKIIENPTVGVIRTRSGSDSTTPSIC